MLSLAGGKLDGGAAEAKNFADPTALQSLATVAYGNANWGGGGAPTYIGANTLTWAAGETSKTTTAYGRQPTIFDVAFGTTGVSTFQVDAITINSPAKTITVTLSNVTGTGAKCLVSGFGP